MQASSEATAVQDVMASERAAMEAVDAKEYVIDV